MDHTWSLLVSGSGEGMAKCLDLFCCSKQAHYYWPNKYLLGFDLPHRLGTTLTHIQRNSGRCRYLMHKWKIKDSVSCDCSENIQTNEHIRTVSQIWIQRWIGWYPQCHRGGLEMAYGPTTASIKCCSANAIHACERDWKCLTWYILGQHLPVSQLYHVHGTSTNTTRYLSSSVIFNWWVPSW